MRKITYSLVALLAVVSMLLAGVGQAAPVKAETTYKMAAIFPGVITDADYNTLAYMAMLDVKASQGVESAYSENVAVPDIDRVMREYIDQGFNIIWTHGSQFLNQTVELAKSFPDLTFIAEGDAPLKDPPANVYLIDRNFHIGYYAIGVLAGKSTKTGKIAYIGGLTLPFSYAEVHAMEQALKDQNLNVELKKVWAGDFNDPAKARQVTDAMLSEGVDVIVCSMNLGIFGVFESVKAAKDPVLVTAKYTDKTSFAPKNVITSLIYDFVGPMNEIIGKLKNGEKGGYYPLGFATGVTLLTPYKNIDEAIGADVDKVIQDIKDGKITVVKDATPIK